VYVSKNKTENYKASSKNHKYGFLGYKFNLLHGRTLKQIKEQSEKKIWTYGLVGEKKATESRKT